MPPAGWHEECFARMQGEANAFGVAKQCKAVGVPILYVVYFRDVWLPGAASTVHIRRLIGCEPDIFLHSLNLHQEGMRMQAIVVQNRKLCSFAADIEFGEGQGRSRCYERMFQ